MAPAPSRPSLALCCLAAAAAVATAAVTDLPASKAVPLAAATVVSGAVVAFPTGMDDGVTCKSKFYTADVGEPAKITSVVALLRSLPDRHTAASRAPGILRSCAWTKRGSSADHPPCGDVNQRTRWLVQVLGTERRLGAAFHHHRRWPLQGAGDDGQEVLRPGLPV